MMFTSRERQHIIMQEALNKQIKRLNLILSLIHGVAMYKSFSFSVLSNYVTLGVAEKIDWEEVVITLYFLNVWVSYSMPIPFYLFILENTDFMTKITPILIPS